MSAFPVAYPVFPAFRRTAQWMRAALYAVALLVIGPVAENGIAMALQSLVR